MTAGLVQPSHCNKSNHQAPLPLFLLEAIEV